MTSQNHNNRSSAMHTKYTNPITITKAYHCTNPHSSSLMGYDITRDTFAGTLMSRPSMIHLSNQLDTVPVTRVIHPPPLTIPSITWESNHDDASPNPITPRRTSPSLRRPVKA